MHCRTRTCIAVAFAVFIAFSAAAAPESRSESGDWVERQITRVVKQLKKLFALPLDDLQPIPPKP
jgi:hypothetical protein